MTTLSRADDGFFHPCSEEQLVGLVELARERRWPLRVRGSAHSIPAAIYSDARLAGRSLAIDVRLDRYARVEIDRATSRVTVEAGCHLGLDPRDPTGSSTWEGSLLAALEAHGLALPDLGGVTHQTISGYLMTGSSGGTLAHAIEDSVLALRLVDGTGRVHELVRDRDELFDAAICSMGLLGIISTVTLQCVPRFDVIGREDVTTEEGAAYELFHDGPTGIASFFERAEYARAMWWPERGVERIATWQARRMRDDDYNEATGPRGALRPKRYSPFGDALPPTLVGPASVAAQWVGGKFYDAADRLGYASPDVVKRDTVFARHVLPTVLGAFVPLDGGKPQRFWDSWFDGLPMDNAISEAGLPTTFTELWLPLETSARAMRALREHFRAGGLDATGSYIFELYAARATRGWLHPGTGRDSLRVDVFWFERSREDPVRFFEQFWDLLAPFDYRLHWGKHLPRDRARGAEYLRARYPRWDDFLRAREELDPDGLFLNEHFRNALGIESRAISPLTSELSSAPLRIFVRPSEAALAPRADASAPLPLRLQHFYEEMSLEREAVLERLGELFTEDIEFKDPFRHTSGLADFRVLFERMLRQYPSVAFTGFEVSSAPDAFTLTYDMRLRMIVGPEFVTPMVSLCTVRDGKVARLADYYDFASGLVSPLGVLREAYQRLTRALFL